MDLIFGGAYQGKLAYAREIYGLADSDIFTCTESGEIDFSKRCVCALEEYVLACVRAGRTPESTFRPNAVLICRDISCGVVPMDAEAREWREAVGRMNAALAAQADTVTRIFCGLPLELKR